jgi:hypothetical protein
VLTANGENPTDGGSDPAPKMMRQIAGSFAEYEKARLVVKLKGARAHVLRAGAPALPSPQVMGLGGATARRPFHRPANIEGAVPIAIPSPDDFGDRDCFPPVSPDAVWNVRQSERLFRVKILANCRTLALVVFGTQGLCLAPSLAF